MKFSTMQRSWQAIVHLQKDFLILWLIPVTHFLNFLKGPELPWGKKKGIDLNAKM